MKVNVVVETTNLSKEQWLQYRKQGLGGSDIASLLGLSKWKSALELWLEKTGQADEFSVENEAMYWGNVLEPVIRTQFSELTGKPVVEVPAILQHLDYPFMIANIDGLTKDDADNPAILEIKTVSEGKRHEWEHQVPVYYQTQVQHYLAVTGLSKAYVAVLIGGNSFEIYEIEADVELQAMLIQVEQHFWYQVEQRIRPAVDGSTAAKNFLEQQYVGGKTEEIVLPESEAMEYIDQYLQACEEEELAKQKKQEASNQLKELMGDYEKATCYGHTITWKSISSERFDTKALKEAQPELYQQYVKTSKTRRFTLK